MPHAEPHGSLFKLVLHFFKKKTESEEVQFDIIERVSRLRSSKGGRFSRGKKEKLQITCNEKEKKCIAKKSFFSEVE